MAIPLRRAPTDVRALTASAVSVLKPQAERFDVTIGLEVDDDVPKEVELDPEKLAWCVATLVGNALRHVKHGGRRMPGGSIRVRVALEGGELVITVKDDGGGIPKEKLPYLFERAAGAAHAVGLSLSLVNEVVKAHGGRVDVESSTEPYASGTTVTLRLPRGARA